MSCRHNAMKFATHADLIRIVSLALVESEISFPGVLQVEGNRRTTFSSSSFFSFFSFLFPLPLHRPLRRPRTNEKPLLDVYSKSGKLLFDPSIPVSNVHVKIVRRIITLNVITPGTSYRWQGEMRSTNARGTNTFSMLIGMSRWKC